MDYINYFKRKYPHIEEDDLDIMLDSSKEILIHLLFKSTYEVSDERKSIAYECYKYWLLRCMQEMIERSGMTSAIAYSENGILINFSQEQLSETLINEVGTIPFVG